MIVIADTGPINYLIRIDEIEILPKLYGRTLVPPSVCDELKDARAPESVRWWIAQPPAWFEIYAPSRVPDMELLGHGSARANAMRFSLRKNWGRMN
jgi:predicted nucleic acid-binding protein